MGLVDQLGYTLKPQSGWRRRLVEVAVHEPMSTVIAKSATPLDRWVFRFSGGRTTSTAFLTGFPVLWVTTTGAKSGRPREVPLLGIPTPNSNLALIGTNFGQRKTPGWVYNLKADPKVGVRWRGVHGSARAVIMSPDDAEPVWKTAAAAYPNYANYRTKAAHRDITMFELQPS